MWEDPIVKEIHDHRQAMLDEVDGNLRALFQKLRDQQKKGDREVVNLPKKTPVSG